MKLSPEPDDRTVTQAASSGQLRPVGGLASQVAAQPRFPVGKEVVHVTLRIDQPRRPVAGTVTTTPGPGG